MFPFDYVFDFIRFILQIFTKPIEMDNNKKQQIFVKWPTNTVPVYLNNDWTIFDLKTTVGKKVNVDPEKVRIIFAGKELHNDVKLEDCDVGEMSVIHAVPDNRDKASQVSASKSVNCTSNLCSQDINSPVGASNSNKAHFFVYCNNPCKSVTPGKLRVRCSSCKEGTLTLQRDPECWDDVLLSNRINGICQSEDCDGNTADFFLKCAKHVTSLDDSVVILPLIKNNFKEVPCIACIDINSTVLVFPCKDGHVICLDCFQLYCNSSLNERKFIEDEVLGYTINCPAGCPDSLIKEPHHFKLLGDEQYARYQLFGAEECVLQAGGVLCPQPGCGAGILPDPECQRIVCSNGCNFVFCRLCREGYHIGPCQESLFGASSEKNISCDITDERAESSRWDIDSKTTIKATTKPCPQCRTPTERNGGCMHMVCIRPLCGFHWCWVCQEEWSRECMGNHWFG